MRRTLVVDADVGHAADDHRSAISDAKGVHQRFAGVDHAIRVQVEISLDGDFFTIGQAGDV